MFLTSLSCISCTIWYVSWFFKNIINNYHKHWTVNVIFNVVNSWRSKNCFEFLVINCMIWNEVKSYQLAIQLKCADGFFLIVSSFFLFSCYHKSCVCMSFSFIKCSLWIWLSEWCQEYRKSLTIFSSHVFSIFGNIIK